MKCSLSEFSVLTLRSILVEKIIIFGYIWPRSFIQTVKCSLLEEKNVYQIFYGASLAFSYFLLQGKVLCFVRVGKSLARCLLSKAFQIPWPKNYISGYIWHKSFIRTVKCSFFKQIIVYQSFYGALLTFSYFLLPGICLAPVGKSLARCLFLNSVPKTTLTKSEVSCAKGASVHKFE